MTTCGWFASGMVAEMQYYRLIKYSEYEARLTQRRYPGLVVHVWPGMICIWL